MRSLLIVVYLVKRCLGSTVGLPVASYSYGNSFPISALAYSPSIPGVLANLTLQIQPSLTLGETITIYLSLPGFAGSGLPRNSTNCAALFPGSMTLLSLCASVSNSQQKILTLTSSAFVSFTYFDDDSTSSTYKFIVLYVSSLPVASESLAILCCVYLPQYSPLNNAMLRVGAFTSSQTFLIPFESIKNSPFLPLANSWSLFQLEFAPPTPFSSSIITITLTPTQSVSPGSLLIVNLPEISRSTSTPLEFSTDGSDWLLFGFYSSWINNSIIFNIVEEWVADRKVVIHTNFGDFILPEEVDPDWTGFTAGVTSGDGLDTLIASTSVFESDYVPYVRNFSSTAITYSTPVPGGVTDLNLTFACNRPLYPGSTVLVKLSGFQSLTEALGIFLSYDSFSSANYNPVTNILKLSVIQSLFFDKGSITVGVSGLILPSGLYQNDPSLKISTLDSDAVFQSIEASPSVGQGKSFLISKLLFDPIVPANPSAITFIMQPSVTLFEMSHILVRLSGFVFTGSSVYLSGRHVNRFINPAHWDSTTYTLKLIVAPHQVVENSEVTEIRLSIDLGFRLPLRLSENDGVLTIQADNGTIIYSEGIKSSPAVGEPKGVVSSALVFNPSISNEATSIDVMFELNTDILPESLVLLKLGGLVYPDDKTVVVTGTNAPLFAGIGTWSSSDQILTLRTVAGVNAGLQTVIAIGIDQGFELPLALYENDPSFLLSIPAAGIPPTPFSTTNQVSKSVKTFLTSSLVYGDVVNFVPYPSVPTSILLSLRPNVDLPSGSRIVLSLSGFTALTKKLPFGPPLTNLQDSRYQAFATDNGLNWYADWDNENGEMSLTVGLGKYVPADQITVLRFDSVQAAISLPSSALANDQSIKISVVTGQIIHPEPFKSSPAIVARAFTFSSLNYDPKQPSQTTTITIAFSASVNIQTSSAVQLTLPGFRNIYSEKRNFHVTGPSAYNVSSSVWNPVSGILTIGFSTTVHSGTLVNLTIAESEGFTLPPSLYANDTSLLISSVNNIVSSPIKISPIVGDGPYSNQLVCMYQYERGIRFHVNDEIKYPLNRQCTDSCVMSDPCSAAELNRCGCTGWKRSPGGFVLSGFNLAMDDKVSFVASTEECSFVNFGASLDWQVPSAPIESESTSSSLIFENVRSLKTGDYKICVNHLGGLFDAGKVVVRSGCDSPLVLVDGICLSHCPNDRIPLNGDCIIDSVIDSNRPVLVSIKMFYAASDLKRLAFLSSLSSPRIYFDFIFAKELASVLNVDRESFSIESVTYASTITDENQIIVNTVFHETSTSNTRSVSRMVSLLSALLNDTDSLIYANNLLFGVDKRYWNQPVSVRICSDGKYRTICPLPLKPESTGITRFWVTTALTIIGMTLVCALIWRMDADSDVFAKFGKISIDQVNELDPSIKAEFARSWLEGRYIENPDKVRIRRLRRVKN